MRNASAWGQEHLEQALSAQEVSGIWGHRSQAMSLVCTPTTSRGLSSAPSSLGRHPQLRDWLVADGQADFARGAEASVTQSEAEAHAAMAMHDALCSPLGLDSARPTLVFSDVRAQPSKKDNGYAI